MGEGRRARAPEWVSTSLKQLVLLFELITEGHLLRRAHTNTVTQ